MIFLATVFNNPFDDGYLPLTTLIPITGAACTPVSSITDGIQKVTFNPSDPPNPPGPPLVRHDVPGTPGSCTWCAWSGPPEGENATPPVLFSGGQTLTMTLTQPARIFGFELMPNLASATGSENHRVQVNFFSGDTLVQSVVKDLTVQCQPENGGSRLFAVQTDDPNELCIDRVVVSVLTPNPSASGFSIAQVRYALCCDTCEDLCTDRNIEFSATFTNELPFTLAQVGTPAFEGNLNDDNVECTTGTCLQSVMLTVCESTFECCVTLGTINFSGTADLLITLPALLDTVCGSQAVSFVNSVTVPIDQTCFTCFGEEDCPPNICGLLDPLTLTATMNNPMDPNQYVISGTVRFNCP